MFATHLHALDAEVPPLDDLAVAEAELEGLPREGGVELLVVALEAALVVHPHHLAALRLWAVARRQVLHHDPALDDPERGTQAPVGQRVKMDSVTVNGLTSYYKCQIRS